MNGAWRRAGVAELQIECYSAAAMKRVPVAFFVIGFCIAFFSTFTRASQVPTIIPAAAKTPAQKENPPAVPQAGKNGYTEPTCIYCPQPKYTDSAFRKKINGTVKLSIVVLPNGRADDVRVVKSLDKALDQASVDIIRKKWRFRPALGPDGKPAAVQNTVEMSFHLY